MTRESPGGPGLRAALEDTPSIRRTLIEGITRDGRTVSLRGSRVRDEHICAPGPSPPCVRLSDFTGVTVQEQRMSDEVGPVGVAAAAVAGLLFFPALIAGPSDAEDSATPRDD